MTEFKTKYGTFGNIQDLYYFMIEEELEEVAIEASYIFSKFFVGELTKKQVHALLQDFKKTLNFDVLQEF